MYKCRECGAKYEIKPDYCECGNDTFVKVLSTNTASNIKITDQKPDDFDSDVEDFREIQEEQNFNRRNTFNELPPPSNDKLSVGIFAVCMFLAFLILFFIGNPKKDQPAAETKQETVAQTPKDIPSLETFWDSTPAKVQTKNSEQPKEEKQTLEIPIVAEIPRIVQQIIPQPKPQEQKTTVKNTPVKTTQKPVQQAQKPKATATAPKTTTAKTTTTTTKPAAATQTQNLITKIKNTQTTQSTQTQQTTQTPKVTTQTSPIQQITTTQAPKPTTTTQTTTTTQNTQAQLAQQAALEAQQKAAAAAQAAKQAAAAKQELANYKNSLRNAIGRKIDFTSVVGDGSCSLSFKIASNGRLTNRAFTKQSSNLTLNEAVYSAMNATPSYNPPPEAYKNETLNLTIKFYNGNFEISLN